MQKRQTVMFGLAVSLSLMVSTTPLAFALDLGEEWSAIKTLLSDAEKSTTLAESLSHVDDAHMRYTQSFKDAAQQVDAASDVLIEDAFQDIRKNHASKDVESASLDRQIVDKTIYKIAFMKMELAVNENNADDFILWYTVLDKKFEISEKDFKSNGMITKIQSSPQSALLANGPAVLEEILEIFKLKIIEELEEAVAALEQGDHSSAKKFTFEGLYYYRTLHPAVDAKLGSQTADELLYAMSNAITVATSDADASAKKSDIQDIASKVELIVREYEGGDTSEIGLALSGIKDRLHLVEVEYVDAVSDGKIINQVEYDETMIFLANVQSILDSARSDLEELSQSDTNALANNVEEMNLIVSSMGNPNQISILVGKSINNIATLEGLAGGEVQIDIFQYFDKMTILLDGAKSSYRNGDTQTALDMVSEAYLDNYEFVEGPLGEVDPVLMVKIETDMRERLRDMIKNNEPADDVDAQIDMILVDLSAARQVVPEFGEIALMIMAVSVISLIAISSSKKTRLGIYTRF